MSLSDQEQLREIAAAIIHGTYLPDGYALGADDVTTLRTIADRIESESPLATLGQYVIQRMSGTEWNADTLDDIAAHAEALGFTIEPYDPDADGDN